MKSNQFCSVCKEWLDMEVVPTSDGEEDDGVIWFRCPQCQGFLPKLSGSESGSESGADTGAPKAAEPATDSATGDASPAAESAPASDDDKSMPWDSPADMMAAQERSAEESTEDSAKDSAEEPSADSVFPDVAAADLDDSDLETGGEDPVVGAPPEAERGEKKKEEAEPAEPIHEYRALLAEKGQGDPTPYRPWETYEVGQCILHQAWEDCGVVVDKEELPGGRQVIKCYFAEAGVVRLIEKAPK